LAINKRKILEAAQKYLQKGALDKALKEYQTLLQADPRDSGTRLKVGDLHLKLGQKEEAITQYTKVAEQFMKDGFDAKAVALYKQILKIDAHRAEVHVPLAELYQRLGLTSEAMAALQTAADTYHREGKKREALDLLRKMATLDPTNTTSRLKIAELLRQAGMPDEAIAEYEEVAQELQRHGETEGLASVYERILELDASRLGALVALARVLIEAGQPERAETHAKRACEARPDAVEGFEIYAEVLRARGRTDALDPVHRKLVELYRARGDEDRAREIQQRYLTGEPLQLGADDSGLAFGGGAGHDDEVLDDRPALRTGDAEAPSPIGAPGEVPGEDITDDQFFAQAAPIDANAATVVVPTPAAPPAPSADAAATPPAPVDVEQMLAEASVYLRYGKHDKASASLEAVLAQEPENRFALEKLGETCVARGETPRGVELWSQAAKLAQAEGDDDVFDALRERIAELDAAAASRLAPAPSAPGRGAPAETTFTVAPAADAGKTVVAFGGAASAQDDATPESDGAAGGDLEIDLDTSLLGDDLDVSLEAGDEASAPGASDADARAPDSAENSDLDLDLDLDVQRGETSPPSPAAAPASAGSSSTTPNQILEDLEEGEFYFHQGLYDEAEAVYRRILAVAPNHPQALLRLGEVAAARGQDPGSSASGMRPLAEPPATPAAAAKPAADALGSSLPDLPLDLDEGPGAPAAPDANEDELVFDEPGKAAPSEDASDRLELPDVPDTGESELDVADMSTPPRVGAPAAAAATTDAWLLSSPDHGGALADDESTEPGGRLADGATAPDLAGAGAGEDAAPNLGLEDIAAELRADAEPAPPPPEPEPPVEAQAPAETPAPNEPDFDLAAELSEALESDAGRAAATPGGVGELDDGFEAVFREFKKGVQRTVGEGDYDTHYDLGIAYREMGLLDDAVGEFQLAMGSPTRKVECLHMLGLCALDSKRAQDAVAHFEQALALPELPEAHALGIRFELGRAYEEVGEPARALGAFRAVMALDAGFQDVEERVSRLERGVLEAQPDLADALDADAAPEAGDGDEADAGDEALPLEELTPQAETFESFDDLLAETHAESARAASAADKAAVAVSEGAEADASDEAPVTESEFERAATTGAETPAPSALAAPELTEPELAEAEDAPIEAPVEREPAPPAAQATDTPAPEKPARGRRRKISFL
jgi:tetratricopeptide (TPR) repeat protein